MGKSTILPKDIGVIGERVAAEYLRRLGFSITAQNVFRKTGEIDIVACKDSIIHIVEVKSVQCHEFPADTVHGGYNPGDNLHAYKRKKIVRTAEWYLGDMGWKGEWQVDGALVWIRARDGMAHISYYPQII